MSHQDFTNPLNVIVIFSHRIQNQGNHNCLCQKPVWRYNQQTSLHCNLTSFFKQSLYAYRYQINEITQNDEDCSKHQMYRTELTSSSNMYKGSWIHSINIKRLPALEVTVFGLSNAFFLQIFLVRLRYLIVQQI